MSKKIIVLMMVAALCISMTYAVVFDTVNEREKVLVTMINQEPDPVAPGNFFDVRFKIENYKTEALKNVEVRIDARYPFSLYGNEDEIIKIGTLAPGQTGENAAKVKYRLLADSNAALGENDIDFAYRVDGGAWIEPEQFTIEVRQRDAVLAINEIKTDCEKMLPGTEANVKFSLENMAESVLKDIKLKLDLYNSEGASVVELPFTPVGSGNEKTVRLIEPGKSKEIDFDLFIDANAESKVYKVPYMLTYSDETGVNFSRSGIVGLIVDAEPEVSMGIDSTTIFSAGTKGKVSIKFVNKGFSNIKFLDVVLSKGDNYDILSNPEVYIGNVDSDDYETADYDLLVSATASDKVVLPVEYNYRDSNGKLYTKKVNLELNLYSGKALQQRVGKAGNPLAGVIIVVVIVAAGVFIWRWRKKKKQQKKK